MKFEVIGHITAIEVIAAGPGIRVLSYLRKAYGRGRWRKLNYETIDKTFCSVH
jgi:hypothetical protein